jgi:predicted MFS family arabinose efflux permease
MSETSSPKNEEVPVKSSIDIEEKGVVHYNFDKSFQQLLSKKIIWILMILISLSHALIYISPGILSSCITQIKIELGLSDEEFGMFGTINGFGALIGSLVFTLIIEKVNHKVLITSALIVIVYAILHFI